MTVTKQQQLEWLAKNLEKWNSGYDFAVVDKRSDGGFYVRWPSACSSGITKKEWQQERDKMQKHDGSWHECGELPPVGVVCEFIKTDDVEWHSQLSTGSEVEILAHYSPCQDSMTVAVFAHKVSDCNRTGRLVGQGAKVCFRPLRTEREKAIDAACKAIGGVGEDGLLIIERIYDAGLLK